MKNLIVLKQSKTGTSSYHLSDNGLRRKLITLVALSFLTVLSAGIGAGYLLFNGNIDSDNVLKNMQSQVSQKQSEVQEFKEKVNRELDSLALQIGGLYAQSARINALGDRLTQIAKLEDAEFDFTTAPGVGGAGLELTNEENTPENLFESLFSIKENFKQQEEQLLLLSELLEEKDLDQQIKPSGKPIRNGWISSSYGTRTDPFTGKQAFHSGLDFSGKKGAIIQAAADGVVIWSGKRGDYGKMVEIDHGSGYITRYAHMSETKVNVGEKVTKTQEIGIMGKSGRATSEHLHFEVLKKNTKVNPWPFISKK